ncbi:MAG: hypothetical protein WC773_00945 [Patescibacteria group bacterium]|jgi:hypothetical protein
MGLVLVLVTLPYSGVLANGSIIKPSTPELVITKSPTVLQIVPAKPLIMPGLSLYQQNLNNEKSNMANVWKQYDEKSGLDIESLNYDQMFGRISNYLDHQGSPMSSIEDLLQIASKYQIDPRLIIGVAGAESTYGIHMPSGSHNPFGLGPTNRYLTWSDGYMAEAQFLYDHFIQFGVFSPFQIGPSYTGTGSQTWGQSVYSVMINI